jgi:hypothetical protein
MIDVAHWPFAAKFSLAPDSQLFGAKRKWAGQQSTPLRSRMTHNGNIAVERQLRGAHRAFSSLDRT